MRRRERAKRGFICKKVCGTFVAHLSHFVKGVMLVWGVRFFGA